MQKCLILGGDGFLGSHLVDDLLELGYEIRVFGRFNKHVKNLNHVLQKIELFSGDFLNPSDLEKALNNIDFVFHFISSSNPASTIDKPFEEMELNILPTIHLLNLCVKKRVKKIIFPSSGGSIYGNVSKGKASEKDLVNPISPHALGKLFIEQLLNYYYVQLGLNYVVYRISNIYGERQRINKGQGIIPTIISKALKEETIKIYGNTIRDYIYVKDVTSFIVNNFSKKQKFKIYNIGSGQGVTLFDLLKIIRRQIKLPLKIKQLERRSSDIERIVLDIKRVDQEFNFSQKTKLKVGIIKTYKSINLKLL